MGQLVCGSQSTMLSSELAWHCCIYHGSCIAARDYLCWLQGHSGERQVSSPDRQSCQVGARTQHQIEGKEGFRSYCKKETNRVSDWHRHHIVAIAIILFVIFHQSESATESKPLILTWAHNSQNHQYSELPLIWTLEATPDLCSYCGPFNLH